MDTTSKVKRIVPSVYTPKDSKESFEMIGLDGLYIHQRPLSMTREKWGEIFAHANAIKSLLEMSSNEFRAFVRESEISHAKAELQKANQADYSPRVESVESNSTPPHLEFRACYDY